MTKLSNATSLGSQNVGKNVSTSPLTTLKMLLHVSGIMEVIPPVRRMCVFDSKTKATV